VLSVKHLLLRLSELDAQAGDELRVISFFDALLQTGADLDRLLLEASRLAECPVGVVVPQLGLRLRVSARCALPAGPAPPYASKHDIPGGGEVWIERLGRAYPIDAMLLERFALACAAVAGAMAPTGRAGLSLGDPALVELVLSASADEAQRVRALKLLGLEPDRPVLVVAVAGEPGEAAGKSARLDGVHGVIVAGPPWPEDEALAAPGALAGVSARLPAVKAARGWQMASTALRFAGPGQLWGRVVRWADLGGFALLAEHLPPAVIGASPDVVALERLAATGESVLVTLDAYAASDSLRQTAARLYLHRSSVAARLAKAEAELGFALHTAEGRARLSLALALRRLATPLAGMPPGGPEG
jgi:hypothetical protein